MPLLRSSEAITSVKPWNILYYGFVPSNLLVNVQGCKVYTLENTPLWKQSINNVGKNPFNQPLNIVMNIASTENAKASAAGSTMTISKVLYFPLQK